MAFLLRSDYTLAGIDSLLTTSELNNSAPEMVCYFKESQMIDRYTKVLLTVIALNLTVMTGWGALEVFVPEIRASASD